MTPTEPLPIDSKVKARAEEAAKEYCTNDSFRDDGYTRDKRHYSAGYLAGVKAERDDDPNYEHIQFIAGRLAGHTEARNDAEGLVEALEWYGADRDDFKAKKARKALSDYKREK